jgi:hypothetical protein
MVSLSQLRVPFLGGSTAPPAAEAAAPSWFEQIGNAAVQELMRAQGALANGIASPGQRDAPEAAGLPNPARTTDSYNSGPGTLKVHRDAAGRESGYSGDLAWDDPAVLLGPLGVALFGEHRAPSVPARAGIDVGNFKDANGKPTYGVNAHADVANVDQTVVKNERGRVGIEGNGPNASAGITVNDSTAQVGAQANVLGGGASAAELNPRSSHDQHGRLALSSGVGAAARLHYGDEDKDGHREYGFGADVGPLAFDVKSEDPVADVVNHLIAGPLAAFGGPIATSELNEHGEVVERNLTDRLLDLF